MENTSPSTKNYEILKTSLLEALSGTDVQIYGEKYDKALGLITQEKRDSFMMDLLRARYLTEQGSEIDSKYIPEYPQHVYRENSGMARELGFMKQNPDHIENIKKFINGLEDYAKIYADISQNQRVFIRHMTESNEINEVYQPILAACATNHEDAEYIAEQYDRLWVLLTLNQLYNENDFRQITHRINRTLRKGNHKSKEDYKKLFDDELQNALKKAGKTSTLDYETFESITYDDTALSFFRYLLARVEKYLREKAKIPSDGKQSVDQLCKRNTHQVERAIYLNETNIQIFGSKEEVEKCQNMLGNLILMPCKAGIDTDATYESKLQAYYQSNLIWGQTLCKEFYTASNEKFKQFSTLQKELFEQFKPYDKFDRQALEERTKLLYELVKIIWEAE